jgi:hypothetical protein
MTRLLNCRNAGRAYVCYEHADHRSCTDYGVAASFRWERQNTCRSVLMGDHRPAEGPSMPVAYIITVACYPAVPGPEQP